MADQPTSPDLDTSAQNERLTFALQAAKVGTWDLDMVNHQVWWDARCKELYGFAQQDVVPYEQVLSYMYEEDRERVNQAVRWALSPASQGRYDIEFRTVGADDGQLRWLHCQGQAYFDEQGRAYRFSGVAQDITQRKQTELLLQQSEARYRALVQKLEDRVQQRTQELEIANYDLRRSNDNLQQFAFVASHDLQEPLRKIQSFSNLLNDQFASQLSETALSYLERIHTAGARMATLIKDLLAYSRIATRQQAFGPVSLSGVVRGVLTTLDWEIKQASAQITVDELPIANGDESQLSQLFQNLLTNAMKFVRPGQSPQINVQYFHCSLAQLPPQVRPNKQVPFYHQISVSDHGIGFDEKFLNRIFLVFQRLHSKSEYPGSGVGLAICQRVVENHGGSITASSQPGAGATFCVYLPA